MSRLPVTIQALLRQRALRARTRWSREELAAHQAAARDAIVAHARERSAFYRERDTDAPVTKAELMERFDDWVTDPRLRRDDVERHLEGLSGDALHLDEFRVMATGGSSGRRGLFVFDRSEWVSVCSVLLRAIQAQGLRPGLPRPRVASVAAPDATHMTWRITKSMGDGPFRREALSVTDPLADTVARLNAFQPDFLNAYPSAGALLALEQIEGRLRIAPKVVSTSSEVCTDEMRERIRAAWGVAPHEIYGATDGLWGATCEHRNLHFAEDHTIVEVEDERILITNLFMRTQPIIRYEITDIVRVSDEPCPCGTPFRTVEAIEGRSDDILRFGDVALHPIVLRSPMAKLDGVRQYQVVQRADGLHVRVVPRRGGVVEEVASAMGRALADAGAPGVPVMVEPVEAIERDASGVGKFKLVRRELETATPRAASA